MVHDPTLDPDQGDSLLSYIRRMARRDAQQFQETPAPIDNSSEPREYISRIVHDADSGGRGLGFGPVDSMYASMRQHSRSAEKKASRMKLHEVLDTPAWKGE